MSQTGQPDTRAEREQPHPPAGAPALSRVQARAAEARATEARAAELRGLAGHSRDLTRPPAAGELAYESTITAPTEWVPYVYTTAEIQTHPARRGLSVASAVCGVLGVLAGIFVIWGVPLSLAAVVLALVARVVERRAGGLWILGLVSGLAGILMAALWFVVITQMLPAYYR
ncbi:hypothetical protein E3O42_06060 [Cryobacterium adonitolivorans]|uniref:DUF4190 domain-containing protein n=1 Tax=Cryobacterium adonitolivorans TaxID=1259189 RepID=A0A4R8WAC6_9MICO|nr:hypothetical protein [Cryobacterium adonitolivorans]TFC03720.1 hypothetical protein E3O42_06060 [Cryobacterium adonitolivorans]